VRASVNHGVLGSPFEHEHRETDAVKLTGGKRPSLCSSSDLDIWRLDHLAMQIWPEQSAAHLRCTPLHRSVMLTCLLHRAIILINWIHWVVVLRDWGRIRTVNR
jgi:hypothetical protein